MKPAKTDRRITIASDASKCNDRNVTETGVAFCREKIATTAAIMIMMTIVNKVPPS